MTKPLHESAIEACRKYQEAAAEVDKLSATIRDSMDMCHEQNRRSFGELHLSIAYKAIRLDAPDDPRPLSAEEVDCLLRDGELEEDVYLGLDDVPLSERYSPDEMACGHCLYAHLLIQQRKHARQRFGAAKRQVRQVGKRAAKEGAE